MTTAPPALQEARSLAIEHLHIAPNSVGIVGGPAHVQTGTSYHLGDDDLKLEKRPYSVYESSRDRHPDEYAAGIDYGLFTRGEANLRHFSAWLVAECRRGAVHTRNIREVIYSLDGVTVKRWDRLNVRSGGDDSHRWHTHVSYFRNSRGAGAADTIREYLYAMGFLTRPAAPAADDKDEDMPYGNSIALPADYAFRSTGPGTADLIDKTAQLVLPLEPAGFGSGAWDERSLAVSLAADFWNDGQPEIVRVAIHDGEHWTVSFHEVGPGPRVKVTVPAARADGAYVLSVGRVLRAEADTEAPGFEVPPVGLCWTIV